MYVRELPCKSFGVFSEVMREIGILKIAKPVGYSEVTKVYDRSNVEALQFMQTFLN